MNGRRSIFLIACAFIIMLVPRAEASPRPASDETATSEVTSADSQETAVDGVFARVNVEAPKELLLGKIQHARVAITLPQGAKVLEVSARSEGAGLGLPLARKWRFVGLKSGKAAVFKVPYQLTGKFQKGALHFDIKTVSPEAKKRAPAQHQTATLRLSR